MTELVHFLKSQSIECRVRMLTLGGGEIARVPKESAMRHWRARNGANPKQSAPQIDIGGRGNHKGTEGIREHETKQTLNNPPTN
jgi:hypothetical protein